MAATNLCDVWPEDFFLARSPQTGASRPQSSERSRRIRSLFIPSEEGFGCKREVKFFFWFSVEQVVVYLMDTN